MANIKPEELEGTDIEQEPRGYGESSVRSEKTVSSADLEPPIPTAEKQPDLPPDGGYGWVCVACVFLINAHTWGVNSSYGIFLAHYLAYDTFPGANALDYAFVGGLSISMALLVSPVATICTRKYGTQISLGIGILLETAGLLGASFASQIWHLFVSQGLAFGCGMGFLFVASVGYILFHFLFSIS